MIRLFFFMYFLTVMYNYDMFRTFWYFNDMFHTFWYFNDIFRHTFILFLAF